MKVSVVIPARNEAENLLILIPQVESVLKPCSYSIITVNDGSTDNTQQIIDKFKEHNSNIISVRRTSNHGFGNALKDGFKAVPSDTTIVIPLMGDLSDDPNDIPKLISAIENGADIAYGSRFVGRNRTKGYPFSKMIANRIYNNTIRVMFGTDKADTTNAFKAYRKEVIDNINMESSGFDISTEIPLKALILGYKSVEVPVTWKNRDNGEAKLKLSENATKYGFRLLGLFFMGLKMSIKDIFGMVSNGSKYKIGLSFIVGMIILMGLTKISGGTDVIEILKGINTWYLLPFFGVATVSTLMRMYRWKMILKASGHDIRSGVVYRSLLFGFLMNYLIPARAGDFMRGFALKAVEYIPNRLSPNSLKNSLSHNSKNINMGISMSTIVVERIMDMIAMAALLGIGMVMVSNQDMFWLSVLSIAIAGIMLGGLVFAYKWNRFTIRVLEKVLRGKKGLVTAFMESLKDGIDKIKKSPSVMTMAMVMSFPIWLAEVGGVWLAAKAVGWDLSYSVSIMAGVGGFLSTTIPVTLGGVGVYEGTVAGVLLMFGVPLYAGMGISLVDHFLRILFCVVVGGISTIHLAFMSRPYFREMKIERERKNGFSK